MQSVDLAAPDVTALTSDGTRFWGLAWYLNLLLEIGTDGRVTKVFDLPTVNRGDDPAGLAFAGSDLWLARSNASDSWLYVLQVEP